MFPNLYDALVYERKFKSEYLESQIYERSLTSEPSIVKLIEKLSEFSIVKFIENQSEHLSKFVLKKISTIDIPRCSKPIAMLIRWENFIMYDMNVITNAIQR